ncbi:MAG: hypothetical protein ACXVCE_13425, partial [Bacteriovorax sp.]
MDLFELTSAEYEFWKERSLREYKQETIRANGLTEAEAEEKAQGDFNRYLPNGLGSPDQYIYSMKDNGALIG